MKVYLSDIENNKKPNKDVVKIISKTIMDNLVDIPLREFAEQLAVKGKTAVLSEKQGNILAKTTPIISQEVIMLDFDNKDSENTYTLEDFELDEFMQEHACFVYKTFSDNNSELDKFRVVFILDRVITKNHDVEEIYKALFKRYPQTDKSVGQTSRLFFGSNKGYEVVDWDNRLDTSMLLQEMKKEYSLVNNKNGSNLEIIDLSTPTYLLLKMRKYSIIKEKLGDNYKQEFPDDYNALNYFKALDMREFLDLPEGNPFLDILHDEINPSASVFYAEQYGIYLYKCFSESKGYTGNIVSLLERYLKITALEVVKLLVDVTGSKVTNESILGQSKFNAQKFKKELQSGELKENYPELYNYFSKYQTEIPVILDFMYDYVYMDDNGELRYLNYYSIKNLSKQLSNVTGKRVSIDKTRQILYHIVVTEIIKKLPESEVPQGILDNIINVQKNDNFKIRTSNVYEPTNLTDENKETSEVIAKVLRENKVTVGSLSYELVYRLFGEEKAYRDFPQAYEPLKDKNYIRMSDTDRNLPRSSTSMEKSAIKIIMKGLEENGYIFEKDVISKLSKTRRLKMRTTNESYQKIRADIYNKYGLTTNRLTKELYEKLDVKGNYSPKTVIYKEKAI